MVSSVPEILAYVQSLKAQDKFAEAQAKAMGKKAGWWWAGFGLSIVLLIILGNTGAGAFIILPILTGVLSLVVGIIFSSQSSKWGKQNIEDRRLDLVTQLFSVLGRDIPRRAKCAVNVSFDDYRTHGTQVSLDKSGFLGNLKRYKYDDTWFTARGLLYDNNRFKITITQTVHRKEKSKRKYTKVNERIQEEVTLLLKVSPESYPHIEKLAPALQSTQFDGLQITRMLAQGDLLRITCATPPAVRVVGRYGTNTDGWDNLATGDTVLKLFLAVYGKLQECRAEQAA